MTAVLLAVMLVLLAPPALQAQTGGEAYVSDSLEITFRRGPGTEFKILKMLKSGEKMKVLGPPEQGWVKAELGDGTVGYVLSRWLTSEEPISRQAAAIMEENETLRSRDRELTLEQERLSRRSTELAAELERVTREMEKAQADLAQFRTDAKDVVKVREELEVLRKQHEILEERYRKAVIAGEEGEERHWWILFGAGVLVFGMIVGAVSRRSSGGYGRIG